jgi:hypothetical protein
MHRCTRNGKLGEADTDEMEEDDGEEDGMEA